MYKKLFLIIGAVMCLLTACVSTGSGGTDSAVLDYQKQVNQLEDELNCRDRAIENGVRRLNSITERCSAEAGTIDEIIELFDEYQRSVERLLYDYYKADDPAGHEDKTDKHPAHSTNNKVYRNDSRLCYLWNRNKAAAVAGHPALTEYENHSYCFT